MEKYAAAVSTPVAYTASTVAVIAGLSVEAWQAVGVMGGLVFAALTLITNFYFKRKEYKLKVKEYFADHE